MRFLIMIFGLFSILSTSFSQSSIDNSSQLVVEANVASAGVGRIINLSEQGFAGMYYGSGTKPQGFLGYVGTGSWEEPSTFQIGSFNDPIHLMFKGSAMEIGSSGIKCSRKLIANENMSLGGMPNDNHRLTIKVQSGNDLVRYLDSDDNQIWHTRLDDNVLSWTESGVSDNRFVLAPGGKIGLNTATISSDAVLEHSNGAKLTSSGIWTDASDITKKENIGNLDYGLSEVLSLHPVRYDYRTNKESSFGFIAQELEKVLPELVFGEEGNMSVAYGQITAVLTKAIQEQQEIIETQQLENENLKEEVLTLSYRITALEKLIAKKL